MLHRKVGQLIEDRRAAVAGGQADDVMSAPCLDRCKRTDSRGRVPPGTRCQHDSTTAATRGRTVESGMKYDLLRCRRLRLLSDLHHCGTGSVRSTNPRCPRHHRRSRSVESRMSTSWICRHPEGHRRCQTRCRHPPAARVGGIGANMAAPAALYLQNLMFGTNVIEAFASPGSTRPSWSARSQLPQAHRCCSRRPL